MILTKLALVRPYLRAIFQCLFLDTTFLKLIQERWILLQNAQIHITRQINSIPSVFCRCSFNYWNLGKFINAFHCVVKQNSFWLLKFTDSCLLLYICIFSQIWSFATPRFVGVHFWKIFTKVEFKKFCQSRILSHWTEGVTSLAMTLIFLAPRPKSLAPGVLSTKKVPMLF